MSIEIFVLSHAALSSLAEWQKAIDAEGADLKLSQEGTFEALNGFLPAGLRDVETGFECDHFDPATFIEESKEAQPELDWDGGWTHVLAFRWGGDFKEAASAYLAASAYARATNGVIYDSEAGEIYTPEQAKPIAQGLLDFAFNE